jgi:hypothetical protein
LRIACYNNGDWLFVDYKERSMSANAHLDTVLLDGYLDNLGESVVQQMLELYLGQSAIYINDIAGSIGIGKQLEWKESCHKMKGAAGSVGLLQVHKKLVEIEKSEEDDDSKKTMVTDLKALNENATDAFFTWLSKG